MDAVTIIPWVAMGFGLGYLLRDRLAVQELSSTSKHYATLVDMLVAKTPENYTAWKAAELEAKRAEVVMAALPQEPPPPWEGDPRYAGKVTVEGDTVWITDDEGNDSGGIATVRRVPYDVWMAQWVETPRAS